MGFALICGMTNLVFAQQTPLQFATRPYSVTSAVHDGPADHASAPILVFREVIQESEAPWIRLHFKDYRLPAKSYVVIRSLEDGGEQRLDARGMGRWRNATAFFNGDAVELELHVAPRETGVFVEVDQLIVGERPSKSGDGGSYQRTLCGEDDRDNTTDNRIGRILPAGCTGWLVSNGAYLTAGHCTDGTGDQMQVLEFNVPSSDCDGTLNFSDPDDQYPIDATTITFFDDGDSGQGRDWAVFGALPNTNHDQLPIERYGGFFRMTRDDSPGTVRVTGFGTDQDPEGCTEGLNADNQTEQTHSGPFKWEIVEGASDVTINYEVDTEPGNSGSPVIILGSTLTLGIHTNGGCTPPFFGNTGTGFESNELETAIRDFTGTIATFVDRGHPGTTEDGTVMRPVATVTQGAQLVTSGGVLSIVAGAYDESVTLDGSMTIRATVGNVIIGQ